MIVAMYLHEMTQLSTPPGRAGRAAGDGFVSACGGCLPPVAGWKTRSYSFRVPVNSMLKNERVGELGGRGGAYKGRSLRVATSTGPVAYSPLGGERQ